MLEDEASWHIAAHVSGLGNTLVNTLGNALINAIGERG
jgi:hypothetical protein